MRSCYTTDWNFGPPVGIVPVTWYFVPEDSRDLGLPTYFQSKNWFDKSLGEDTVLGEVLGADRIYTKGQIPFALALSGVPCGTARQFAGLDPASNVPLFAGFPACCLPPGFEVFRMDAGLVVAGTCQTALAAMDAGLVVAGELAAALELDAGLVVAGELAAALELDAGLVVAGERSAALELDAGLVVAGELAAALELDAGLVVAGEMFIGTVFSLSLAIAGQMTLAHGMEGALVVATETVRQEVMQMAIALGGDFTTKGPLLAEFQDWFDLDRS